MAAKSGTGKGNNKPAPALLWLERHLFLNRTARVPEVKLWSSLKDVLPLYQELRVADVIGGLPNENWYEHELFPFEARSALDSWASQNGYSDYWFKNVGAIQLYFWTLDPESLESGIVHVPSIGHSGLREGVPPPVSFRFHMQWRPWNPYTGEQWQEFARRAKEDFKVYLESYHQECLEACPSLAWLRGYAFYDEVAKYQAGLLPRKLDEASFKRITRTARRIGLTLRKRHNP